MSDPILVLVTFTLKPDQVDAFWTDTVPEMLKETQARSEIVSVSAVRKPDAPDTIMFVDVFADAEALASYSAWRAEIGSAKAMEPLMAAAPVVVNWGPITTSA